MAVVEGNYFDIDGAAMPGNIPDILFWLNRPNVTGVGAAAGNMYPTKVTSVTPAADGSFSQNLAVTATMHFDAWYEVALRWNQGNGAGPEGTLWDPGLRIRVPDSAGPHKISDLLDRSTSGGGANPMIWWFGLTPPPSRATIWNYLDPDDPDRETGPIPELVIGDIITSW